MTHKTTIAVIGLGYVGLPLARAFARRFPVIGYDADISRVASLNAEVGSRLTITPDPAQIRAADFVIICVPTPVAASKEPDLSFVKQASQVVSQNLKKGATVILESTVYPGATEEIVKPILENSGLTFGQDFHLAYSPERINPGDDEHDIGNITKVVAAVDDRTTDLVAELYSAITPTVFKAKDIRTAEAAKVIENVQRDLNIALVNEFALVFEKLGLDTKAVLDAAATKWNFHRYLPGLVGGHCIPVDPYYLVYKARQVDYHPQVILAGRATNDYMPKHVAEIAIKELNNVGKVIRGSRVLVLGLTYKENVADTRETPVRALIKRLQEYGIRVCAHDPLVDDIAREFGIEAVARIEDADNIDCAIITVAHDSFRRVRPETLLHVMNASPILIDVARIFERRDAEEHVVRYRSL